jgi:Family of unknown function (DUF6228)
MDTLRLKSLNSDVAIEFSEVDGDYFSVAILAHDHSAARRVCAYTDAHGIVRVFAEAARDWKGWDGPKAWESLEREFRMELTMDRLGHVALGVRIRSDPGGPDPWEHHAELAMEAGQLEAIARDAKRLWLDGG